MKKEVKDLIKSLQEKPAGFIYTEKQENSDKLQTLYAQYKNCMSCPLANQGRSKVVFGEGNPNTKLMFIGEGPGKNEDLQGRPFVGRAGQLLNKIIEAMGMKREDIYISNIVKCRPPSNRAPLPEETGKCTSILLFKEIEIIQPKIICALGATAVQALLGPKTTLASVRGNFQKFKNILLMPTYHPAYLLRNPAKKSTVWQDMQKVMKHI